MRSLRNMGTKRRSRSVYEFFAPGLYWAVIVHFCLDCFWNSGSFSSCFLFSTAIGGYSGTMIFLVVVESESCQLFRLLWIFRFLFCFGPLFLYRVVGYFLWNFDLVVYTCTILGSRVLNSESRRLKSSFSFLGNLLLLILLSPFL